MPAGRPSSYSEAIADAICDGLLETNLYRLCKQDGLPARSTVLRWMQENSDFATRCARADKLRGQMWSSKVEETAEDCDETNAQSSKVKISAYQWLASKEDAKYGDKLDVSGDLKVTRIVVHDDAPASIVIPLPKPEFDDDAA